MKTTLFVRPNLKIFLLAALAVAVLKECVFPADSSPLRTSVSARSQATAFISDDALEQMLDQTLSQPTAQRYAFLSECYKKRGDYKLAMLYLRKAFLAADLEAAEN